MNPLHFFQSVRASLFRPMAQGQVDGCNALLWASEGLDKTWQAYLLATAYHETAQTMQPIVERGGPSYLAKYDAGTTLGKRLGNTVKGDGARFKGRGYVQITGRANYAKAGAALSVDLVGNPDLALDPEIAAKIAIRGMTEGWFTGKTFKDYLPGDYVNARRIINGLDRAQLIAGYARHFEDALSS